MTCFGVLNGKPVLSRLKPSLTRTVFVGNIATLSTSSHIPVSDDLLVALSVYVDAIQDVCIDPTYFFLS
ncbi:uncharacterized protein B0H18DRAFT_556674 [Fomitopsis serialis]|uniref:uncharacterized protein n=1 Tax=Fomitopsis serialis TaxID=139415 RepID=UPI0020088279|nr:uncharacterized protein B0H18DRAFT_556674 [Neoantrodia serialis]KAH9934357.1 hypothetical protein B0H18DRAFT_556674 [Neoantrodia serialis]